MSKRTWLQVAKCLGARELLLTFALVCRQFARLTDIAELWSALCRSYGFGAVKPKHVSSYKLMFRCAVRSRRLLALQDWQGSVQVFDGQKWQRPSLKAPPWAEWLQCLYDGSVIGATSTGLFWLDQQGSRDLPAALIDRKAPGRVCTVECLYLFGGVNLSSAESLKLGEQVWTNLPDMPLTLAHFQPCQHRCLLLLAARGLTLQYFDTKRAMYDSYLLEMELWSAGFADSESEIYILTPNALVAVGVSIASYRSCQLLRQRTSVAAIYQRGQIFFSESLARTVVVKRFDPESLSIRLFLPSSL